MDGHSLDVDEGFLANLIQLPNEGISSFYDVSMLDVKEMQFVVSASGKLINVSDQKQEPKFEFQLLADTAAKDILAKAGSFAILTLEIFQVMTTIMKEIKVNWSAVIFSILKNMLHSSKNSRGYAVQLSILIEDAGIVLEISSAPHKFKFFTAASITSQKPYQLLSPSFPMSCILKHKAKRKLFVEETDSEKTSSPSIVSQES